MRIIIESMSDNAEIMFDGKWFFRSMDGEFAMVYIVPPHQDAAIGQSTVESVFIPISVLSHE